MTMAAVMSIPINPNRTLAQRRTLLYVIITAKNRSRTI
jgi:hypothetical protein